VRVGLYLRISVADEDDEDGTLTATERQEQDCRRFAQQQGWEIADVFKDEGISAYKRVLRPEFDRMVKAVQDREIDGVLCWHLDRLTRQLNPYVRLMDALQATGGFIRTVTDGVDTRTNAGEFVALVLVGHAKMSSADTARRVQRNHEEWAKAGRPHTGGNRRPFGYTMGYTEVIEDEAVVIRDVVQRVISGESLNGICGDLNRRGIKTSAGNLWQNITLRTMLLSYGLSGRRVYNGIAHAGNWQAIITPEEQERVRAILEGHTAPRTVRRYLLTGFLRCGRCGHDLRALPTTRQRSYVCFKISHKPNCGKLRRQAEPLEEYIKQAILVALDGVDLREYVEKPTPATGLLAVDIRRDEEALMELSKDFYADQLITRAEFFSARDTLQGRIEDKRKQLARTNGHGILNQLVNAGAEVQRLWDTKGLDWQRSVVGALIDHITILPTVRGERHFNPQAVEIRWKF
jgi:site-specific DNA recombinase